MTLVFLPTIHVWYRYFNRLNQTKQKKKNKDIGDDSKEKGNLNQRCEQPRFRRRPPRQRYTPRSTLFNHRETFIYMEHKVIFDRLWRFAARHDTEKVWNEILVKYFVMSTVWEGAKRIIQLVTGNNIWKTIWETPRFPWMSNLVLNELLEDFIESVPTQVEEGREPNFSSKEILEFFKWVGGYYCS